MHTMESNRNLVSLVLPIYNVEPYLERCLESIVNQTYSNLQIICIIDGSKDNSIVICRKYAQKDPRVEVFEQVNSGCAVARNNALKKVRGEYVCFIDPDDYIDPCYVESLLTESLSACSDIAIATMLRVKGNSVKPRTNYLGVQKYEGKKSIFSAANCPPEYAVINKMYKTSLLFENNIEFETGCLWCDDVRFCVEALLCAKSVVTVERATYYYVKRTNSISHSQTSEKKQLQRYKIQRNAISACIANGVDIPAEELWITKIVKSFFGIPLLRCRVNVETAREHWFVFGVIPVFAKKNYD